MLKILVPAAGLVALAGAAQAHVTLEQSEAAIGGTTKITLRIPHGCDGEATETVRVTLPDGFYDARPMPKAGWTLETVTGPYATPQHGTATTEGVREIAWSGGSLADAWYDEFVLRGTIGPDLEPGAVMHFPVVQECASGTSDWTDVSGEEGVANPAPGLTLVPASGADPHAAHGGAASGPSWGVGAIGIAHPFARATLPNSPVGGGFMSIGNAGDEDDRLVAVASPAAGRVEIHEMAMEGDVMRMRELEDGLPVPAGETVVLEPGGHHIMFMDLREPLVEGENVDVTLSFENAGEVTVPLAIGPTDAGAGTGHGAMDHGQMHH
jgi:periplasmic copper chaperone A